MSVLLAPSSRVCWAPGLFAALAAGPRLGAASPPSTRPRACLQRALHRSRSRPPRAGSAGYLLREELDDALAHDKSASPQWPGWTWRSPPRATPAACAWTTWPSATSSGSPCATCSTEIASGKGRHTAASSSTEVRPMTPPTSPTPGIAAASGQPAAGSLGRRPQDPPRPRHLDGPGAGRLGAGESMILQPTARHRAFPKRQARPGCAGGGDAMAVTPASSVSARTPWPPRRPTEPGRPLRRGADHRELQTWTRRPGALEGELMAYSL